MISASGRVAALRRQAMRLSELLVRQLLDGAAAGVLRAACRAASSMRSSWLYFATRSLRLAEPVLIWPARVPTARSAIVRVLGLARAVRGDRRVAGVPRHLHRVERLGDRADLIELDQQRVADALRDAFAARISGLVTNTSSPTSCTLSPSAGRQHLPAVPVALGEAVLDRDDRVLADPVGVHRDHLLVGRARLVARLLEDVLGRSVVPELAGGDVERDADVARRP